MNNITDKIRAYLLYSLLCLPHILCTSCSTNIKVTAEQGKYVVIKQKLKKDICPTQSISFQYINNGVFLTAEEFSKIATNINNLNVCLNTAYDKGIAIKNGYEKDLEILGAIFEEDNSTNSN